MYSLLLEARVAARGSVSEALTRGHLTMFLARSGLPSACAFPLKGLSPDGQSIGRIPDVRR